MKAVLVNDTTQFNHFGCWLVIEAFKDQLDRVGVELLGTVPTSQTRKPEHVNKYAKADVLLVNGEGSIHHNAHADLIKIAGDYPAVLVNCVYQENNPLPEMHRFLYRAARESLSAEQIRSEGVQCDVIPDIILTSKRLNRTRPVKVWSGVGVTDCARPTEEGFTAHMEPDAYLQHLMGFQKVVCGRFHAALCCAVLGIPFSLYSSNTHKNRGLAIDMGIPHLYADTREKAIHICPDTFDEQITEYVQLGKQRINQFFEDVADGKIHPGSTNLYRRQTGCLQPLS